MICIIVQVDVISESQVQTSEQHCRIEEQLACMKYCRTMFELRQQLRQMPEDTFHEVSD